MKFTSDKKNSKTFSNCYSLTIRTGNGVFLGSSSISKVIELLHSLSDYYVLSIEKEGVEAHLQGGFFNISQELRQDKVREKFLPLALQLYEDIELLNNGLITTKGKENVKKHAVKLVSHNNFKVLSNYCLKDPIRILTYKFPTSNYIDYFCIHDNPPGCPKCPIFDNLGHNNYL